MRDMTGRPTRCLYGDQSEGNTSKQLTAYVASRIYLEAALAPPQIHRQLIPVTYLLVNTTTESSSDVFPPESARINVRKRVQHLYRSTS
jgi:hypothetical protein